MVVESEKIFFNSANSMFSHYDSTRCNNVTPTSAHVKKIFNSTLKYAAMATSTQQCSYKQGCGVGVPESHVLDPSGSTFFRFDNVEVASRSCFLIWWSWEIGVFIVVVDFD